MNLDTPIFMIESPSLSPPAGSTLQTGRSLRTKTTSSCSRRCRTRSPSPIYLQTCLTSTPSQTTTIPPTRHSRRTSLNPYRPPPARFPSSIDRTCIATAPGATHRCCPAQILTRCPYQCPRAISMFTCPAHQSRPMVLHSSTAPAPRTSLQAPSNVSPRTLLDFVPTSRGRFSVMWTRSSGYGSWRSFVTFSRIQRP